MKKCLQSFREEEVKDMIQALRMLDDIQKKKLLAKIQFCKQVSIKQRDGN